MSRTSGTDPSTSGTEIVAIVASFHPPEQLATNVAGLIAQFSHVVVVDDGSTADSAAILDAVTATGATVLLSPSNRGIAATLNVGIRHAREEWDPEFFATFDQDSVPVANYAARALETFSEAEAADVPVGFVVASSYSGRPTRSRRSPLPVLVALDPMQSGFVIPRGTLKSVGLFDEGFVIDGVDSEYTARARAAGLVAVIGSGCEIEHELGRRDPALLFGRPLRALGTQVSFNYHSPQRAYYIMRNGVTLTRRYVFKDPIWVGLRLIEEAKAHILRLAFSPDRLALVRAMTAGLLDAVAKRQGRAPQSTAGASR